MGIPFAEPLSGPGLSPGPEERPGPETAIAGRSPDEVARAARRGRGAAGRIGNRLRKELADPGAGIEVTGWVTAAVRHLRKGERFMGRSPGFQISGGENCGPAKGV